MARTRVAAQDATALGIRTGAVRVKSLTVVQFQRTAPVLYLQLFNLNGPTVGVTVPDGSFQVAAGLTRAITAGGAAQNTSEPTRRKYVFAGSRGGLFFDTGLAIACTTTPAGNTNPTAGDEPLVEIEWEPL